MESQKRQVQSHNGKQILDSCHFFRLGAGPSWLAQITLKMPDPQPVSDVVPDESAKPKMAEPSTAPSSEPRARRERKQANFFTPDEPKSDGQRKVIPEGKGVKLSEIPNVAFHFSKVKGSLELMESIHHLLFKSKGKLSTRKKDIMAFSGLVYEDDADRSKYSERLGKWKLDDINKFMDLLDAAKVGALLDFLEKPEKVSDTDKAEKVAKAKEKKAKAKEKAEKTMETKLATKTKTPRSSAKKPASKAAAEKEEAPKSSAKRKVAPKEAPRKRTKRSMGEPKGDPEEAEDAEGPSDEELEAAIVEILKDAKDDFSIKDLLNKLQAKYNMSFKDRKPFLKEFATNYLKNKIEEKTEAPQETAAAAEEQAEKPEEEKAKAVETEADVAAEQPPEEAPAGEPAAGGAVAAPMDTAAEEPKAVAPAAEAAAPVEAPAAQLGTGAAPMEEDVVPSAVEDHSIKHLTAGEVPTSAAADTVMAAAVEKAVDAMDAAPQGIENGDTAPSIAKP
ncbi:hypothetical protein CVIRNUC_007842 [Coccomyxa viridis]|uniref:DEK C-terminal domain-containing protein n=1 Tax=Coccomyxa viridis TaxID=1274662 RepID=A0AAV1IBB8_9CHLO|nr:hypothetical protein CVIRNUC_007842 [Coccomyxa viridis]